MMRWLGVIAACVVCSAAAAQSLDDQFDRDRFLRGLAELNLPEVIEHYIEQHPAEDDITQAEYQLALARATLREPGLSSEQRELRVQALLNQRDALIESHENDYRRALWLADQAGDVYYELLPLDASGVTALVGVPSQRQRQRAARASRLMLHYAEAAEQTLDRAIRALESTEGFAEDIELQLLRRRMVEDERDRRIPFLHGVAACLHARINVDDVAKRMALFETAVSLLTPTIDRLPPPLNHRASVYAGFAHLHIGRREEAAAHFASVLDAELDDPLLSFLAARGEASASRNPAHRLGELGQRYDDDELFFRLLIADAQFLAQRDDDIGEALTAYTVLLSTNTDPETHQLREAVFARLQRAIDLSATPEQDGRWIDDVPALAVVAQAARLLRNDLPHDAVALLQDLLADRDVDAHEGALARMMLANAHLASAEPLEAARQFLHVAEKYPRQSEAQQAMQQAASLAAQVYRDAPDRARPVLEKALNLLLERYTDLPNINYWRYIAGQVALAERAHDRAIEHFASVAADSREAPEAAFLRVRARRMAADDRAGTARHEAALQRVLEAASQARQVINAAADEDGPATSEHYRNRLASIAILEAEALVLLHSPSEALAAIAHLDEADDLPGRITALLLQVRIDCYRALGDVDKAQQEVDRFITAAPQRVVPVLLPWLTSLQQEVLARRDALDDHGADELAQRELSPLAARLHRWLDDADDAAQRDAVLPHIADGYRLGERYDDAFELYEQVLQEQPNAVQALFGKAECLYHLSADDESEPLAQAMTIYRRIAGAGRDIGEAYYWQAQLRTLQILDRIDRNTDQIVPKIQQLRHEDRTLGGERLRRQFQRLRNKHL